MVLRFTCFLFVIIGAFCSVAQRELHIATYNLRYNNPNDSLNAWPYRVQAVADLIHYTDFDVFGTQEGYEDQLADLDSLLPEYGRYGVGRDDGKKAGEHSAIFYKRDRFIVKDSGDFWLSQTPNLPSKGWDATCCNRLCSYVLLQDKQNMREFYVFNAHFDHQGNKAREESSKLILAKIRELAGNLPVVFTGDLNGDRSTTLYQILAESKVLHDSYSDVLTPYQPTGSFNGFGKIAPNKSVIDHIFLSGALKATSWAVLTNTAMGRYLSDHFPVAVTIEW